MRDSRNRRLTVRLGLSDTSAICFLMLAIFIDTSGVHAPTYSCKLFHGTFFKYCAHGIFMRAYNMGRMPHVIYVMLWSCMCTHGLLINNTLHNRYQPPDQQRRFDCCIMFENWTMEICMTSDAAGRQSFGPVRSRLLKFGTPSQITIQTMDLFKYKSPLSLIKCRSASETPSVEHDQIASSSDIYHASDAQLVTSGVRGVVRY